ncbi:hypothetical protein L3X38_045055 [Prunus dulcis]|uniref:Uncharacterized protein n=1 Tax=Prunus dulcis TaxID=3755 RepID=A0AAD4YP04_PRUDU|nr:hypothetical protein L3X38_045055 [Prunus dulcis]
MQNPEDFVVRDGRMTSRPTRRWPAVTVARVDFDVLHTRLIEHLTDTLMGHNPLRHQFDGSQAEIDRAIGNATTMLLDQALFELWNRLRVIAGTYDYQTRINVFNRRAPVMEGFQLPRFYASLLSSIGPLRIEDSFFDTTVIYSPAKALNFGRAVMPNNNSQEILHFIQQLGGAHIPLGTIQHRGSQGSFFTTCARVYNDYDSYNILGAFNARHYNRIDTVIGMLLRPFGDAEHPFEDLSTTLGFVDNEDVIKALPDVDQNGNPPAASPPPAAGNPPAAGHPPPAGPPPPSSYLPATGHPPAADPPPPASYLPATGNPHAPDPPPAVGNPPAATTRHVQGDYNIDYNGIAPASDIPVQGRKRGIYILGRGYDRIGTCSLARDLSGLEIAAIFRHRIIQAPA